MDCFLIGQIVLLLLTKLGPALGSAVSLVLPNRLCGITLLAILADPFTGSSEVWCTSVLVVLKALGSRVNKQE